MLFFNHSPIPHTTFSLLLVSTFKIVTRFLLDWALNNLLTLAVVRLWRRWRS
jgi:branched-subunit amino acid transport protein AzlD